MIQIILFLVLIAAAGFGVAWLTDQGGDVALNWGGWHIETSVPVALLGLAVLIIVVLVVVAVLGALWRAPSRIRQGHRARRHARGRHAITQGLIAIGTGDPVAARRHAQIARRDAQHDPLALLLHAQAAQLDGDREGARRVFRAMSERPETRLLGLRGLYVEAQRADDAQAAVAIAEEALKTAPAAPWASHAILGFRCASGDWNGALGLIEARFAAGQIDKALYRRERGVLLTARALDLETSDRDRARESVMEAVKLAPTLVPAAVLAGRFFSEAHQIRRAMKVLETAWLAQPHPDLADAYAHVRLGDSARQRLGRVETLAARTPGHIEGALAVARAAIDASEFDKARAALAPFVAAATQRVAMLMAEIERGQHGDSGRARAWTRRAVRAAHDPVWTADGYVSDRWRAVSPVTGRLDAFQWQTPLAALPSDKAVDVDSELPDLLAPPRPTVAASALTTPPPATVELPAQDPVAAETPLSRDLPQDNAPPPSPVIEATADTGPAAGAGIAAAPPSAAEPQPAAVPQPPVAPTPAAVPPVFRPRADLAKAAPAPVIPILRAPDDPGIDETLTTDDFGEPVYPPEAQRGGWRGFLSRWGA